MTAKEPFSRDLILRIVRAPALLETVFEKPQYQQMLDAVQKGNLFLIEYSPHERFFILPPDDAATLGIINPKNPGISAMYLADKNRRNFLSDITHGETGFELTTGRKKSLRTLAVIASEAVIEKTLGEFYVRPATPEIPPMKIAARKAFSVAHNEKILGPAPETSPHIDPPEPK